MGVFVVIVIVILVTIVVSKNQERDKEGNPKYETAGIVFSMFYFLFQLIVTAICLMFFARILFNF